MPSKSVKILLTTVAQKGSGLISEVKEYPGTDLITLIRDNRDEVVTDIIRRLSRLGD